MGTSPHRGKRTRRKIASEKYEGARGRGRPVPSLVYDALRAGIGGPCRPLLFLETVNNSKVGLVPLSLPSSRPPRPRSSIWVKGGNSRTNRMKRRTTMIEMPPRRKMGELRRPNANMAPAAAPRRRDLPTEFIAPLSVFSCSVGVIERNGVVKKEMKEKKMGEFLILLSRPRSSHFLSASLLSPIYFVSLGPSPPLPLTHSLTLLHSGCLFASWHGRSRSLLSG